MEREAGMQVVRRAVSVGVNEWPEIAPCVDCVAAAAPSADSRERLSLHNSDEPTKIKPVIPYSIENASRCTCVVCASLVSDMPPADGLASRYGLRRS